MKKQIVISASRRTDIPAFYMDWFMDGIARGYFTVKNPFNQAPGIVRATPEAVHTIVFWSKDFGPFLAGSFGENLRQSGYHLFFNFTVNTESDILEPNIPPLADRLAQAAELCRRFGPQTLQWRFDPVCFYRTQTGVRNNLGDFAPIAGRMAQMGVGWCVTSFADIYAKLRRRTANQPDFDWIDPPVDQKIRVLQRMQQVLEKHGMNLYTCCEKDVLEALPQNTGILPSACIPNRYLVELYGGSLSFQKDAGQRSKKGCGCMTARDIGGYADQPCYHNCRYCYANPSIPAENRRTAQNP